MTGLSIAIYLQSALSSDPDIRAKVGDRIFPISTVTSTSFPFIVYDRDSVSTEYTKDGRDIDRVVCTVYVMSDTYTESVEIAESVRSALEAGSGDAGPGVRGSEFVGAVESFTNDTFVQQLQFEFEVE